MASCGSKRDGYIFPVTMDEIFAGTSRVVLKKRVVSLQVIMSGLVANKNVAMLLPPRSLALL